MTEKRWRCKRCLRYSHEVGHISKRGYCHDCGQAVKAQTRLEIAQRSGPAYDNWHRRWELAGGNNGRPPTSFEQSET